MITLAVKRDSGHNTSLLQRQQVNHINRHFFQIGQTHLSGIITCQRNKAAFRQTALQRHLTTLKAYLMKAA